MTSPGEGDDMPRWIDAAEEHPRRALFLRTQAPFAGAIAIVAILLAFGDVPPTAVTGILVGLGVVALVTLLAVVVPWERLPADANAVLPICDILAVGIIAFALRESIDTVAIVVAFPVIWLAANHGMWGSVVAVVGTLLVSIVPRLFATNRLDSPTAWVEALVPPIVVAAVVIVITTFSAQVMRSQQTMRVALAAQRDASAEAERISTMLRSFADNSRLALAFLDPAGNTVFINQPAVELGELARVHPETRVAERAYAVDQVTPLPAEEQPFSRLLRGESFTDLIFWAGPRGMQRAYAATGGPVSGPGGAASGSLLLIQDVTTLIRATRVREDALATLAHELRTPLTSIVGYTDLLLMKNLPADVADPVQVISRNAEHLLGLTQTFLDGLRPDADISRERVALADLVQRALDDQRMAEGFAEREITVEVGEDVAVHGDADRLAQIVNNLVENAVKYTRPGDSIRVSGQIDEDNAVLIVQDSGPGIDPDDLERVFDRFYRGETAQRAAIGGTGIGLDVSRRIAAAHGGTLTAEPSDRGARFRLCLPRATDDVSG